MCITVHCGKDKYLDVVVRENAEVISMQRLPTSVYPMEGLGKLCCLVFPSYRWDANQTPERLELRRRAQVPLYLTSSTLR